MTQTTFAILAIFFYSAATYGLGDSSIDTGMAHGAVPGSTWFDVADEDAGTLQQPETTCYSF